MLWIMKRETQVHSNTDDTFVRLFRIFQDSGTLKQHITGIMQSCVLAYRFQQTLCPIL